MLGELTRRGVVPVWLCRADRARRAGVDVLGAEEVGHVWVRRSAEDVRGIALLQQASLVEEQGDVADETCFGEIVRHVQNRRTAIEVPRADLSPNGGAAPRIERGEWLIEEEHARPASEGAGQRHELPLAAAQRSHVTIGHELQAEAIDHLVGIRARARTIRDVLAHSEVREEITVLVYEPEVAPLWR